MKHDKLLIKYLLDQWFFNYSFLINKYNALIYRKAILNLSAFPILKKLINRFLTKNHISKR